MSIKIMTRVWESSELKGSELLMLLAIADNARDDGHAWPGLSTLAKKTRLSRQTVSKKLPRLVEAGELYIHAKKGYVHHYVVMVDMPPHERKETIAKVEAKRGQPTEFKVGGGKDGVTVPPVNTGRRPWETRGDGGGKDGATRSVNNHKESSSDADDIFRVYEHVTGRLVTGGKQPEELKDMESQFPIEWIRDAFGKAVNAGARNPIGYAWTCLEGWAREGRDSKPSDSSGTGVPVFDEATGEFRL